MEIKIDESQLRDVQSMLTGIKNGYPKVLTRAVNKTLTGVRTDAKKEIAKDLNLTQKRIGEDFKIRKMSFSRLTGQIDSVGKPVGLASFTGTKQKAKGVSVKVKKTGKRSIIKHTFLANVRGKTEAGDKEHVFYRLYTGPRAKFRPGFPYSMLPKKYRYPGAPGASLERKTGPRVQDIYASDKVMKPVLSMADDRLAANLEHELNRELSKL